MDNIRPFLELKLFDCQETVSIKGLCAELDVTVYAAQKALNEFVASLKNSESVEYPLDSIYYFIDILDGRVTLKFRPIASFLSDHQVIAVAAKFEVQDLVETDIAHLLEGRLPTILKPSISVTKTAI